MIGSIEGINSGKVTGSVTCHQLLFPYLLYYYHSVPNVRVYQVDILDPNSYGVAICHLNTSGLALGQIEVFHWIFQNDVTWTVVY
ncbi:polygalacturonase-1 non-catalytic subunit beta [Quercus suber]|uniref:Polygalacturonase-1 non-catalytic subunit beta n=1 Tax=Quercus suber TaxID=58331 RepID=A0AAW0LKE3_QUESU